MRVSSITKNAGKACNNRLYRHIRTFEKIIKNYFVISSKYKIHSPEYIEELDYDAVIVAIDSKQTSENVKNDLCNWGVDNDKIVLL